MTSSTPARSVGPATSPSFAWNKVWLVGGGNDPTSVGAYFEGAGTLSVSQILRFDSGPVGGDLAGFAFLVLAAVPVVVGREWRAAWALRGWTVAVAGWGVVWLGEGGWSPIPLPAPEVMLAPAAAGIALAAGMAAVAIERDVLGGGFTWRHLGPVVAVAALVVGIGPFIVASGDWRWYLPRNDFDVALSFLQAEEEDAPFRVLWLGDPEVLPLSGWRLSEGTAYATSVVHSWHLSTARDRFRRRTRIRRWRQASRGAVKSRK